MENDNRLPESVILVYGYMYNNRTDDGRKTFWRGYGKEIAEAEKLQLSLVYQAIGKLVTLGSIKKLRHGAKDSPSIYQILKAPDGKQYEDLKDRSLMTGRLEMPSQWSRVQDSINRLNRRMNDFERRLERLETGDRHNI